MLLVSDGLCDSSNLLNKLHPVLDTLAQALFSVTDVRPAKLLWRHTTNDNRNISSSVVSHNHTCTTPLSAQLLSLSGFLWLLACRVKCYWLKDSAISSLISFFFHIGSKAVFLFSTCQKLLQVGKNINSLMHTLAGLSSSTYMYVLKRDPAAACNIIKAHSPETLQKKIPVNSLFC